MIGSRCCYPGQRARPFRMWPGRRRSFVGRVVPTTAGFSTEAGAYAVAQRPDDPSKSPYRSSPGDRR
jgi:hypothetical protein